MSLSPRERIEASLHHEEPDRTPIFEYVLHPPLADVFLERHHADYTYDLEAWTCRENEVGRLGAIRAYVEDRLDLAAILGHDMLYVCPNPPQLDSRGEAGHTKSILPPIHPLEGDPVERLIARNARARENGPSFPPDSLVVYQVLREAMSDRGVDLPVLAPAYAHGVWTDSDLMQTMVLAPEIAQEHFRLATQRSLSRIEAYLELGIDQIGIGGDFAGKRPMISPALYRSFIVPEVRELSRRIHGAGAWAVNASDGDLWSVIDAFLIDCEVDGYLEIDMFAGMDLRRLKDRYGQQVTLYGNMDCGNVLSFGSIEEIRHATREIIEAGLIGGGHIFCASNAITAAVSLQSYLAMVNAYRDFFALAPVRFERS